MKYKSTITKKEYKKALKERRIYVVGLNSAWTQFRVYVLRNGQLERIRVECSNNIEKDYGWSYRVTGWGLNRVLELILNIGYALGLDFNEIKQNYTVLN